MPAGAESHASSYPPVRLTGTQMVTVIPGLHAAKMLASTSLLAEAHFTSGPCTINEISSHQHRPCPTQADGIEEGESSSMRRCTEQNDAEGPRQLGKDSVQNSVCRGHLVRRGQGVACAMAYESAVLVANGEWELVPQPFTALQQMFWCILCAFWHDSQPP